jgi:hypothetical protein
MKEKEVVLFGVQMPQEYKNEPPVKRRNTGLKVLTNYMNFFDKVHESLRRNDNSFPTEVRRKLEREYKVPWNILAICKRLGYINNYETKKWAFTTRINKKKVENILDIANKVKIGEVALEDVNESMRSGKRLRRTNVYRKMITEKARQGELFSNRIISRKRKDKCLDPLNKANPKVRDYVMSESEKNSKDIENAINELKKQVMKPKRIILLNQITGATTYCSSIEEATKIAIDYEEGFGKKFLVLEVAREIYEEVKVQINDL